MKLTEDYKEKLNAVVKRIIQRYSPEGFDSKEDMLDAIERTARELDIGEYRLGTSSKAWKDFVKDVVPLVKAKVKIASPLRGVKKGPRVPWRNPELLRNAAYEIETAVGNTFPDGDPYDLLIPEIMKLGVDSHHVYKVLDAAAKQYLGAETVNDYLIDMWDSVYADAKYDYEQWKNADPKTRGQEPHLYRVLGGDHAQNPWKPFGESMKFSKSLGESLEDYDNKIENAIAELLNIDEDQGKEIADKMEFQDYIDFAMAIDKDDTDEAFDIVRRYAPSADVTEHPEAATVESVAQSIHYLIKTNENNVLVPGLKYLNEMQQRELVSEMNLSEMQKILANLRGFNEPGIYERSLFTVQLVEEIIIKLKNTKINKLIEVSTLAPGKQQQIKAYGAKDDQAGMQMANKGKEMATFTNDKGEQEEGEVVSSSGNMVNVRTSKGVKAFDKSQVGMAESEDNIIRLKELAGIKVQESQASQRVLDAINSYEAGSISKEELYNTIREEYPGVSIDAIMRQLGAK